MAEIERVGSGPGVVVFVGLAVTFDADGRAMPEPVEYTFESRLVSAEEYETWPKTTP